MAQDEPRNLQENFKVTASYRRAIATLCKNNDVTKAELLEHMLVRELAAAPAPASAAQPLRVRERRPDREGKKLISGHFPKSTWADLRRLSIERETTSQELLEEALSDLFAKYHSHG